MYRSKEDGFNLLEFVRFFLNVIEHEEIETLYLTIALIDFFKEISQSCGYRDKLQFIDITNYICNVNTLLFSVFWKKETPKIRYKANTHLIIGQSSLTSR